MRTLKQLKKGEYFTLKNISHPTENQVFVKGEYDRTERKYVIYKFNNINSFRCLSGDKVIYTDFIF